MSSDTRLVDARTRLSTDGIALVKGLLDDRSLADALSAFQWSMANPSPYYQGEFRDDAASVQDLSNPRAYEAYRPMLGRSPFPEFISRLWEGSSVWFMYEQIFYKRRGAGRTRWHQDSPYLPVEGSHLLVAWLSFEPVSREEALEFCAGSHLGPLYNGTSFETDDVTDPFYKTGDLPRLPNIEAERQKWRIIGWPTNPGDVILFNPSVLHGGGAPDSGRERRTLTLRFFGDDARYTIRPGPTPAPNIEGLHQSLKPGEPFRNPVFPNLA